jgi:hypothetical protein
LIAVAKSAAYFGIEAQMGYQPKVSLVEELLEVCGTGIRETDLIPFAPMTTSS